MASPSINLKFRKQTEEAFRFYKSVFGGAFAGSITRYGDIPLTAGMSPQSDEEKNLIMQVSLPIPGGVTLVGSDIPESLGDSLLYGNAMHIVLHPDTRAEADELFTRLSKGGIVDKPMTEKFWGDYSGECTDKFGICWGISYLNNTPPVY